jgi:hypothetical protein
MVLKGLLGVLVFFREYGDSYIALLTQGKNSQRPDDTFPEMVLMQIDRLWEV